MKIAFILLILFLIYFVYSAGIFLWRVRVGIELSDSSERFERILPNAPYSILIIGDSTAVGTGVTDPKDSIAGLFAKDFPDVSITNLGENGTRTRELIPQLEKLGERNFDLVILHSGGNDIVKFTNLNQLSDDIAVVLQLASAIGNHAVLITSGNIGTAPLFPWPISWIISSRTRSVHGNFKKIANEKGVLWVPLYAEKEHDPFFENINESYAHDMFHPATRGYQIWYAAILKTLENGGVKIGDS